MSEVCAEASGTLADAAGPRESGLQASFGTPQSLGCVELPLASAAKVWPFTPIGTLVTVEK